MLMGMEEKADLRHHFTTMTIHNIIPSPIVFERPIKSMFPSSFQAPGQHGHHGLRPGRGGRLHRALPRHRPAPSVQGRVIQMESEQVMKTSGNKRL